MTSAQYFTSLLLSCEQWELLRRLKNSGLTTEIIVDALEEIQQIECLFPLKTCIINKTFIDIPNRSNSLPSLTDNTGLSKINQIDNINEKSSKNYYATRHRNASNTPHSSITTIVPSVQSSLEDIQQNQQCPLEKKNNLSLFMIDSIQKEQKLSDDVKRVSLSSNVDENFNVWPPSLYFDKNNSDYCIRSNNKQLISMYCDEIQSLSYLKNDFTEIDKDDLTELQLFMAKGYINIREEVSTFVRNHCLRRAQVAKLAGVNQAYISKFMRGDFYDLSQNGFSAICRWYLKCRKSVADITAMISSDVDDLSATSNKQINSVTFESTMQATSQNMLVPTLFEWPKRTRFTFKQEHLQILESAFSQNPYPDPRKREELSQICNLSRRNLNNEREIVTEQIITHWFQNKRRLMKKALCRDLCDGSINFEESMTIKSVRDIDCQSVDGNESI